MEKFFVVISPAVSLLAKGGAMRHAGLPQAENCFCKGAK